MTPREMAKFYLRYWSGADNIAANAPLPLWFLANRMNRVELGAALRSLADNVPLPVPGTSEILSWFAANQAAVQHFDEIMGGRKPPTTFAELAERAYRAAQQIELNRVRDFLKAEIEKHGS